LPFHPVLAIKPIMKKFLLLTALISLGLAPAFAQVGPGGGGPNLGGAMDKLFGVNQAFSAKMDFQTSQGQGNPLTVPGKISFDSGKSRFEMNMSEMRGSQMPPNAGAQLKAMGMDTVISISRPDLKLGYLVYPGLSSYTEITAHDSTNTSSPDDFKVVTVEAGQETVDGHDCAKNNVTVTGKDGVKHEYTVWNAIDLKNFPVKVVTTEAGSSVTMVFRNVSLGKPAAGTFDPPAGYSKYDNAQTMLQTEMMKKMGGGAPPAPH